MYGSSLGEVLAAVRAAHGDNPRFAQILGISSLLLGEEPLGSRDPASVPVRAGDVVEVLPPFAGG